MAPVIISVRHWLQLVVAKDAYDAVRVIPTVWLARGVRYPTPQMCQKPLIQPLTQEEKDRLNGKYGQLVTTKSAAALGATCM